MTMKTYEVSFEKNFSDVVSVDAEHDREAVEKYVRQEHDAGWSDRLLLHVREAGSTRVQSFDVALEHKLEVRVSPAKTRGR